MTETRIFVQNMPVKAKIQCMYDHEWYEMQGTIGDCELRNRTEELMEMIGAEKHQFVLFCEIMIKEIYRDFAYRWLDSYYLSCCKNKNE